MTAFGQKRSLNVRRNMKSLDQLINRWKDERLALLPAASELVIRETFGSLGYSATTDVLALYTAVGGMDEMDKVSWRLWPLTEIKNENATSSSGGVLFSDFAADCWRFRLKANSKQLAPSSWMTSRGVRPFRWQIVSRRSSTCI
jgi:hypothetical protein